MDEWVSEWVAKPELYGGWYDVGLGNESRLNETSSWWVIREMVERTLSTAACFVNVNEYGLQNWVSSSNNIIKAIVRIVSILSLL